jgi:hypothetical protein
MDAECSKYTPHWRRHLGYRHLHLCRYGSVVFVHKLAAAPHQLLFMMVMMSV